MTVLLEIKYQIIYKFIIMHMLTCMDGWAKKGRFGAGGISRLHFSPNFFINVIDVN
jgi:hypothetical protein